MQLSEHSDRARKLDKVLSDVDKMEDDGTSFGVSRKIQALIKSVIEIYEPVLNGTESYFVRDAETSRKI
jgi:hypothetical protein